MKLKFFGGIVNMYFAKIYLLNFIYHMRYKYLFFCFSFESKFNI